MRKFKFFNIEITTSLTIRAVKRVVIPIPDKADDTHYNHATKAVKYYIGSTPYIVCLEDHMEAEQVSVTKRYDKVNMCRNTDREIVIDLYK